VDTLQNNAVVQRILLWTGPTIIGILVIALIPLAHFVPARSPASDSQVMMAFFTSGPFSWAGIVGFYLPAITFCIWVGVMTSVLLRVLREETALSAAADRLAHPQATPAAMTAGTPNIAG
jgi:hypothetical protein